MDKNKRLLANIIATWFGSGLSPKAPGTAGSLATMPLAILLCYWTAFSGVMFVSLLFFAVGVWATHIVIQEANDKDPAKVVIDETVGQLLTFSLVTPYLHLNLTYWWIYPLGFLLFRFFDIKKMGLVKHFDKRHDAWGVMLDDVIAGINASIVLCIICYFVVKYLY
ncbi:MAG: phosphatidylglycerophosphatase A [Alphaproteobacteria bacterium]|nr:phosphatidylglycerophosphatase A [Alphaproteobacteria bacterium]